MASAPKYIIDVELTPTHADSVKEEDFVNHTWSPWLHIHVRHML